MQKLTAKFKAKLTKTPATKFRSDGSLFQRMKRSGGLRLAMLLVSCLPLLATPSAARAADSDIKNDARLEGYSGIKTHFEETGTAMCWILLIILGVIALGVLLKSPNRTDLP